MKIMISGMNGYVGKALNKHFIAAGQSVQGIRLRDDSAVKDIVRAIDGSDVVINLSGANILARWSDSYKAELYRSRVLTTRRLVEAISQCKNPPKTLLSASAVGIYDSDHCHTGTSQNLSADFLGTLCVEWEMEARKAENYGVRVCTMRFGVIYGKDGGAMSKMLLPFKLGLGGMIGSGTQKVSWIHRDDLVSACEHLIEHEELSGAFNFTAPEIVTNREQTQTLAKVLNRPAFFGVPAFAVKLLFGEGATVLLDSKEVCPERLLASGFRFRYPTQELAFRQIVSNSGNYIWYSAPLPNRYNIGHFRIS